MEEKVITPQESLQILDRMLSDTRNRFYNNGFAFLFWGILVILTCLVSYVLHRSGVNGMDGYIWVTATVLGIIVTIIYYANISTKKHSRTKLDGISGQLWIGYGISYLVLMYLCAHYSIFAPPFIYCLLGMGMFVNGGIYKFWALYAGAIVFWLGAIISTLLKDDINQLLISMAIMFIGYLIPGYLLWKKAKEAQHV